ncbi:secondary thiamine-phosphate synthase enzyme YjbQ [Prochlorococcus sp. MIT 1300]|uniref:secondary thiamine-phosphate synthase enzyme YjbQ n=1 Tax=Prochlorococcus sp. MIT 1300 TaxID=3096218 RepID=UPI002A75BE26|nr:secondary thiamine-phosphate synthase enzyme YjbQ [Prochlorococcus sp. MIT 1300]
MPLEQSLDRLKIRTSGSGFTDLTPFLNEWVSASKLIKGVLYLTALHTSCSLTINENADPDVLKDLSNYMKALVPEEGFKPLSGHGPKSTFLHSSEGKDDMPAHIRTSLTCTSMSLSIDLGKLILGTWQAVYLWEHRESEHLRTISLHAVGEFES